LGKEINKLKDMKRKYENRGYVGKRKYNFEERWLGV